MPTCFGSGNCNHGKPDCFAGNLAGRARPKHFQSLEVIMLTITMFVISVGLVIRVYAIVRDIHSSWDDRQGCAEDSLWPGDNDHV